MVAADIAGKDNRNPRSRKRVSGFLPFAFILLNIVVSPIDSKKISAAGSYLF
jgi:hypothetical protein